MGNKITGYRELTETEVRLINDVKRLELLHDGVMSLIAEHNQVEIDAGTEEGRESARWAAIGKTHLEQGIMALIRAVAKPERHKP